MADVAADVPGKFDLIIDGHGYLFAEPEEGNRAHYTYTPTFLARQNVSEAFGDNQQDFFLTIGQNDWSLGEEQQHFTVGDDARKRRYFSSTGVDPITVPGEVTIRRTVGTLTFAGAVLGITETPSKIYCANATKVYSVDTAGSITDEGAHGLGSDPAKWGITADARNVFVSNSAQKIRKYNGSAWADFATSGADSLCFLGNTLYGYDETHATFVQYDTSGVQTVLYTWKDALGAALTGSTYATRLRPFGGKIYMLRLVGIRGRAELWQYDGSAVSQLAEFPVNFIAGELEQVDGVAFISGYLSRNADKLPAIYYYVNGTMGRLWKSQTAGYTNATWPVMAPYDEGLAFTDDTTGRLLLYNVATGGVHTLGTYSATAGTPGMAGNSTIIVHTLNSTTGYYFPTSTVKSAVTVDSSLIDFENTLPKQFRGIKVNAVIPSGATLDISYQLDSTTGSWTSLQTGAVSGTEYTLSGVSGQAIAVRITLNKGSSAAGPTLRRVYVRASPFLQSYRRGEYVIDCTGRDGRNIKMRNEQAHPLDGLAMATNLVTAITSGATISVTDRFGTFTGVLEPEGCEFVEIRPEEFVVKIRARAV